MSPTMEISYSLTRSEIWRWYWDSLRDNSKHRALWLVNLGGWGLTVFVIQSSILHKPFAQSAALSVLGACFIAMFLALYP